MKFIVDRKKWFRGKGSDDSALLREDGTRCCIGFVGQQCGVPDSLIMNRACVREAQQDVVPGFPKWLSVDRGSYDTQGAEAYLVNDNPKYGDEVREARLKLIFAKYGDEIEFVD